MTDYKILKPRDFPPRRSKHGAPTVHFDIDHGIVYFSKGICELIGLEQGDRILVVQSEARPNIFGFKKTELKDVSFALRRRSSGKAGLCFVNMSLVRLILTTIGTLRNAAVQVGREPEDGVFWVLAGSLPKPMPK